MDYSTKLFLIDLTVKRHCWSKLKKLELRDLDLRYSSELYRLPEQIYEFDTLETLRLSDSERLHIIPDGISKMKNLKYLFIENCKNLHHLPNDLLDNPMLKVISNVDNIEKCKDADCPYSGKHIDLSNYQNWININKEENEYEYLAAKLQVQVGEQHLETVEFN